MTILTSEKHQKNTEKMRNLTELAGEIRRSLRKLHSITIFFDKYLDKGAKREWESAIKSLNLMLAYTERDINKLQHYDLFSDLDDIAQREIESAKQIEIELASNPIDPARDRHKKDTVTRRLLRTADIWNMTVDIHLRAVYTDLGTFYTFTVTHRSGSGEVAVKEYDTFAEINAYLVSVNQPSLTTHDHPIIKKFISDTNK